MNTAYGTTLDSLMAGKIASQQADAAEASAFRDFLARMADTRSMDRYRRGDIDVRGRDVEGMNDSRRYKALNDERDSFTRRMDVESLSQYRPKSLELQRDIEAGRNAARLAEIAEQNKGRRDVATIGAGNRGMFGGSSDAVTLAASDMLDRSNASNQIQRITDQIQSEANRLRSGKNKYFGMWDSSEYDDLQKLANMQFDGDIDKAAMRKAVEKVLGATKDAHMFNVSYGPDGSPEISVGESPFMRALGAGPAYVAPTGPPQTILSAPTNAPLEYIITNTPSMSAGTNYMNFPGAPEDLNGAGVRPIGVGPAQNTAQANIGDSLLSQFLSNMDRYR
jgi:hypothetical protein